MVSGTSEATVRQVLVEAAVALLTDNPMQFGYRSQIAWHLPEYEREMNHQ